MAPVEANLVAHVTILAATGHMRVHKRRTKIGNLERKEWDAKFQW
jgi:hypothetical protein